MLGTGTTDGATALNLSAAAERLGELAAEHGIAYVDAPVVGTKEPAEKVELIVLASGQGELPGRCDPVFGAIGKKTFWVGEAGRGSRSSRRRSRRWS